ncbi:MAG TPA: biotin transporter BioY [Candidatus Limnocylindrales bacterium]|nr:biotin transporter BioY [Candidatus Limnocylindrales bacterium]
MTIVPQINRLPIDQRGVTLADFLVPITVGERVSARARHLGLVIAGALFIALTAQITIVQEGQTIPIIADFRITLAETPVPITGQTFGVLLVGGALGLRRGVSSVLLYLAMGLLLPVYADHGSGLDTFITRESGSWALAPTGGYLVGFALAAAITGRLAELGWDRNSLGAAAAMLLGNVAIYLVGVPWLAASLGVDLATAIAFGLTPFIVIDLLKLLAAAGMFRASWWVIGRRPGER